jgi:vancomycin permeability regulator SanA
LSSGLKAAQCCHALRQFVSEHKERELKWFTTSNYLVLLETDWLEQIVFLAKTNGIKYSCFYEPDLDNLLTAVALEPGVKSKKMCSNLKLVG